MTGSGSIARGPFVRKQAGVFVVAADPSVRVLVQKVCAGVIQSIARDPATALDPVAWSRTIGEIPGQVDGSMSTRTLTLTGSGSESASLARACVSDNTAGGTQLMNLLEGLGPLDELCSLVFGPAKLGWTSVTLCALAVSRTDPGSLTSKPAKVQIQQTLGSIDTSSPAARQRLLEVFGGFTPLPNCPYYMSE